MNEFEYHKARSVRDAVSMLSKYGAKSRVLAAGNGSVSTLEMCLSFMGSLHCNIRLVRLLQRYPYSSRNGKAISFGTS